MSRRAMVTQILLRQLPMSEEQIMQAMHQGGDLAVTPRSLRMILRGHPEVERGKFRCTQKGPLGQAKWVLEVAPTVISSGDFPDAHERRGRMGGFPA